MRICPKHPRRLGGRFTSIHALQLRHSDRPNRHPLASVLGHLVHARHLSLSLVPLRSLLLRFPRPQRPRNERLTTQVSRLLSPFFFLSPLAPALAPISTPSSRAQYFFSLIPPSSCLPPPLLLSQLQPQTTEIPPPSHRQPIRIG